MIKLKVYLNFEILYCLTFILTLIVKNIAKTDQCKCFRRESIPLVINTWNYTIETEIAWDTLIRGGSALDAIELGCSICETEQCDHTVGWGGSPDESGETTLDAMIMDGSTHNIGAVGSLRRIKSAISVARRVLENTEHTLLVGDLATDFAVQMGFNEENLTSEWSKLNFIHWKGNNCQPNYWCNVEPNPSQFCGPYKPKLTLNQCEKQDLVSTQSHKTIGMIAIDGNGNIAVGTSTNGLINRIPGRVGDTPIPGSGAYADQEFGGAVATGEGDIIMRFLPSYQAVENLRHGMSPREAAEEAINRISKWFPKTEVAILVADIDGNYGSACVNIEGGLQFSVCNPMLGSVTLMKVKCMTK